MNRLDLIIDALENAVSEWEGDSDEYEKALAAARELKALKPAAWMYKGNFHDFDPNEWASPEFVVTPLYTAPPRKKWVGLTEDERFKIATEMGALNADWIEFAFEIEKHVRLKNT
jgi:hypothetical protein